MSDRDLLEQFLLLIKDNYKNADKAAFFLEERSGISNIYGITNLRDVLSHLATFLDPALNEEQRKSQIAAAEEHLRRAILEPYQIAVEDLTVRFQALYEQYKERVLPIVDRHAALADAPSREHIETVLREVEKLLAAGRTAKGKNLWDKKWEEGVACLIRAFDLLYTLNTNMEAHWYHYLQVKREKKQIVLTAWSTVTTAMLSGITVFTATRYYDNISPTRLVNFLGDVAVRTFLSMVAVVFFVILGSLLDRRKELARVLQTTNTHFVLAFRKSVEYIGNITLGRS